MTDEESLAKLTSLSEERLASSSKVGYGVLCSKLALSKAPSLVNAPSSRALF